MPRPVGQVRISVDAVHFWSKDRLSFALSKQFPKTKFLAKDFGKLELVFSTYMWQFCIALQLKCQGGFVSKITTVLSFRPLFPSSRPLCSVYLNFILYFHTQSNGPNFLFPIKTRIRSPPQAATSTSQNRGSWNRVHESKTKTRHAREYAIPGLRFGIQDTGTGKEAI